MTLFVQAPGGSLKYTFEWEDVIPENVTFESVTYDVGELTLDSAVISNEDATSTIQLSGARHGAMYVVKALALLSNGETVPNLDLVIRGFNG